jgi:hypothetical protein
MGPSACLRAVACRGLLLLLQAAVAAAPAATVGEWRAARRSGAAPGVSAPDCEWDGQAFRLPTRGWLYADRSNVTLRVDVSHVPAEAFRAEWRWELWLNGMKASDLVLTPASPAVAIVVSDFRAGRHDVQVRLHGAHGVREGELVPFFVDPEGSSFSAVRWRWPLALSRSLSLSLARAHSLSL